MQRSRLLPLFAGLMVTTACSGPPLEGDPPETVGVGALELSGSIDDRPFSRRYEWILAAAGPAGFDLHFHTHGDVFLTAPDPVEPSRDAPTSAGSSGVFRMPAEGPSAGEHLCAGAGSWYAAGEDTDQPGFELRAVSALGTCPGEPVSGGIDACPREQSEPDAACPTGKHLLGTLDGVELDWTEQVIGYRLHLGADDTAGLRIKLANGSVLLLDLEADRVVGGFFSIAGSDTPATVAYCVGGGSVIGDPASGPFRLQLGDLSRLGACGERPMGGLVSGRY